MGICLRITFLSFVSHSNPNILKLPLKANPQRICKWAVGSWNPVMSQYFLAWCLPWSRVHPEVITNCIHEVHYMLSWNQLHCNMRYHLTSLIGWHKYLATTQQLINNTQATYIDLYSESNNYLIPCWFCRFAHLERMELCIIEIIGTFRNRISQKSPE